LSKDEKEVVVVTDKCEIAKQYGRVTAKCGDKTIDLGKMPSDEVKEKVIKETEEDCPTCGSAIAVGWAINYIKPLNNLIADKIFNDVTDEKMTPDEAMDKCAAVAQQHGKKDLVETIKGLKEMMHKPVEQLEAETDGKTQS